MTQEHFATNSRLLQALNTCINEDQVIGSFSQLIREVNKIETFSGHSLRTIKLRNEIVILEAKMAYINSRANLRAEAKDCSL